MRDLDLRVNLCYVRKRFGEPSEFYFKGKANKSGFSVVCQEETSTGQKNIPLKRHSKRKKHAENKRNAEMFN